MGFCFLANIGIAAKYALSKYGLERVAAIDFDVHHGNG
jgi:acetoin utilization deacetylase AcuC-like enzyme